MFKNIENVLRNESSLHVILISIYYVFHNLINLDSENINGFETVGILGVLFISSYFFDRLIRLFVIDKFNARYILSLLLILLFFYYDIYDFLGRYTVDTPRNRYVYLGLFLGLVLLFVLLRNSKRRTMPTFYLNVLLCIYLLIDIFSLFSLNTSNNSNDSNEIRNATIQSTYPDVYFILLDGYANGKTFLDYYHYNNQPFLDTLRSKGFYIADDSKSNYAFTLQTLSSTLNLDYHKSSQHNLSYEFMDQIASNITVKQLERCGYKIFNFSIFHLENHKTPYVLTSWFHRKNLLSLLLSRSILYPFVTTDEKGEGVQRELNVFNAVNNTAIQQAGDTAKFIYAHTLLPHVPFYLDKNGHVDKNVDLRNPTLGALLPLVDQDTTNNTLGSYEKDSLLKYDYINHIQFTNVKCLESINTILSKNKRPAIIILMSDHGSRMLTNPTPSSIQRAEQYLNFCAIYYPDKNYKGLYKTITPINLMRIVLNKATGSKYPRLHDISGLSIQ